MKFNIEDNVLLSCEKDDNDSDAVVIPEGVTGIAQEAFKGNTDICKVTLPETLVLIGREAFSECCSLESINIPESVKDIGKAAFYGCYHLKDIVLPKGLISIQDFAFGHTGIEKIELPESLEIIENSAFSHSCLTEITIPASVKTIGHRAFAECRELKTVILSEGLETIDDGAFSECWRLESVDIPEGTKKIGGGAFYRSGVKKVTLPKSLRKIDSFAFGYTQLGAVEIPGGVEEIESIAFYHIPLKKIVLPDSVTKIGGDFVDSKVKVVLGENNPAMIQRNRYILSRDGKTLLRSANRKEAIIPEGVETIGPSAFSECCDLERVVMPSSVTKIDRLAFCSCKKLKEAILSPNIKTIEQHAFLHCSELGNLTLPESLEFLADAFSSCNFERLVIPPRTVITNDFFFWHDLENIKKLTINLSADDFPQDEFNKARNRDIAAKIIMGFVDGMNTGYPFGAEVIEMNHSRIRSMGTAMLLNFPEDFIYYTIKNRIITPETAEKLLELYNDISLSLRSAIAEYTAKSADPIDRFKL